MQDVPANASGRAIGHPPFELGFAVLLAGLGLFSWGQAWAYDLPECDSGEPVVLPPGARVGRIEIENGNVFDTDDPEESRVFHHWANRLHVVTADSTIRQRLLFHPGDRLSLQSLEESERLIREVEYLYDGELCASRINDNVVDVDIRTRDVWTLRPSFSFGLSGGHSSHRIGFSDGNFLGTGVRLGIDRRFDVDRTSTEFSYSDPNLGDSWLDAGFDYADRSDGYKIAARLALPFYSLQTRRAATVEYLNEEDVVPLYGLGEKRDEFVRHRSHQRVSVGRSGGLANGWATRWILGVAHDAAAFRSLPESTGLVALPDDRDLRYPFVGFELLQDAFDTDRNLDQIGRTEDLFVGTRVRAEAGWASTVLGSDRNALVFDAEANFGMVPDADSRILSSMDLAGRWDSGHLANTALSGEVEYYRRQTDHWLFYAGFSGSLGTRLDRDQPRMLGGDTGLRGYPRKYQGGDSSALLTVEERLFTDWYPFHLFRVGFAGFVDIGRTWGPSPTGDVNLGVLRDAGVGVRLGSPRSGLGNIVHIDLAMPLDGEDDLGSLQLTVRAHRGF